MIIDKKITKKIVDTFSISLFLYVVLFDLYNFEFELLKVDLSNFDLIPFYNTSIILFLLINILIIMSVLAVSFVLRHITKKGNDNEK